MEILSRYEFQLYPESIWHTGQFKFGNGALYSKCSMKFRISLDQNYFLSIIANIMEKDVPLLLELDILESYKPSSDITGTVGISKDNSSKINHVGKLGHLYCLWTIYMLYTTNKEDTSPFVLCALRSHFQFLEKIQRS